MSLVRASVTRAKSNIQKKTTIMGSRPQGVVFLNLSLPVALLDFLLAVNREIIENQGTEEQELRLHQLNHRIFLILSYYIRLCLPCIIRNELTKGPAHRQRLQQTDVFSRPSVPEPTFRHLLGSYYIDEINLLFLFSLATNFLPLYLLLLILFHPSLGQSKSREQTKRLFVWSLPVSPPDCDSTPWIKKVLMGGQFKNFIRARGIPRRDSLAQESFFTLPGTSYLSFRMTRRKLNHTVKWSSSQEEKDAMKGVALEFTVRVVSA